MDLHKNLPDGSRLPYSEEYGNLIDALSRAHMTTVDLLLCTPLQISQRCRRSINEVRQFLRELARELQGEVSSRTLTAEELLADNPEELETDSPAEITAGTPTDTRPEALTETPSQTPTGHHLSFPSQPPAATLPSQKLRLQPKWITTGDTAIDAALGGGIRTGELTEVTGESATGKSHFLMQLAVTVQLPPCNGGLGRNSIYISTESGLETRRMIDFVTFFQSRDSEVAIDRVYCIKCSDYESQDHVLQYQLPLAIRKYNIGLIILDSVSSHFRAEFDMGGWENRQNRSLQLTRIASHLSQLARRHNVAVVLSNQVADLPVTVGAPEESSLLSQGSESSTVPAPQWQSALRLNAQLGWFAGWPPEAVLAVHSQNRRDFKAEPINWGSVGHVPEPEPQGDSVLASVDATTRQNCALDTIQFLAAPQIAHKKRKTASNTERNLSLKIPTLGLIWANLIATRILLTKRTVRKRQKMVITNQNDPGYYDSGHTREDFEAELNGYAEVDAEVEAVQQVFRAPIKRELRVIFSPHAAPGIVVQYEIAKDGVRSVEG